MKVTSTGMFRATGRWSVPKTRKLLQEFWRCVQSKVETRFVWRSPISCICMVIGVTLYQIKDVVTLFRRYGTDRWLVTCEHGLSHFRKHWQLQRLIVVITWCTWCVLWHDVCSCVSYTVIFFVRTTEPINNQATTGNSWLRFSHTKDLGEIPIGSPPTGTPNRLHIVYEKNYDFFGGILEMMKGA